jgi:hypothetical protein
MTYAIALLHGRGAQGRGVTTHVRLGQTEGAEQLALRQRGQPLFLLRLVAVAHQDGVDRAVGHADRGAGAAITSGDFFEHQRQSQVVEVRTTISFGHADAVGAELPPGPGARLSGNGAPCPTSGGVRPQLFLGKGAHRVADHFLVLGQ